MPTEAPPAEGGYREIAPPGAARQHLVCLWTHALEPGGAAVEQPVLPDACLDILWIGDDPPVVAGPATRAVVARVAPGTRIVGARFRPGGWAGVLRVDASELQDRHLPLDEVAPALARRFSTAVAERASMSGRVEVAGVLLARLLADAPPPDAVVRGTVRWLAANPGARVGDVGRALHVSPRQLQRRVLAEVGYAPKTLHRILRLQRLLALAEGVGRGASLSTLALRAGYADQAHMTREARELTGRTPSSLLPGSGSALGMADLFGIP